MHDLEQTRLSQPPAAITSPEPDETDTEDDPPAPRPGRPARGGRTREGLPAGYRMRHAAHYVEQLIGDGPIHTVRQVAIDQIDPAGGAEPVRALDLDALSRSMQRVGMLQPLLVVPRPAGRFEILAGEARWRAAQRAGLTTVPCLIVHVDEGRAMELRGQAEITAAPMVTGSADRASEDGLAAFAGSTDATVRSPQAGSTDATVRSPQAGSTDATVRSTLHRAVLADLLAVERRQATLVEAARRVAAGEAPLRPAPIDWDPLVAGLRADAAREARLRGVRLEWRTAGDLGPAKADPAALATAWGAILHGALGAAGDGDGIVVSVATPRIRPALVLTVAVERASLPVAADEDAAAAAVFGGDEGGLLLAAARQAARGHGGRLTVTPRPGGATIDFVIPQLFAWWP